MTLSEFIVKLTKLEQQGHGSKEVYYRHGSSGDCGELSLPLVTDHTDEFGPFDLDDGEQYISIFAGN